MRLHQQQRSLGQLSTSSRSTRGQQLLPCARSPGVLGASVMPVPLVVPGMAGGDAMASTIMDKPSTPAWLRGEGAQGIYPTTLGH